MNEPVIIDAEYKNITPYQGGTSLMPSVLGTVSTTGEITSVHKRAILESDGIIRPRVYVRVNNNLWPQALGYGVLTFVISCIVASISGAVGFVATPLAMAAIWSYYVAKNSQTEYEVQ